VSSIDYYTFPTKILCPPPIKKNAGWWICPSKYSTSRAQAGRRDSEYLLSTTLVLQGILFRVGTNTFCRKCEQLWLGSYNCTYLIDTINRKVLFSDQIDKDNMKWMDHSFLISLKKLISHIIPRVTHGFLLKVIHYYIMY